MAFMERQISEKQTWFEVDGEQGIDFIPADLVDGHVAPVGTVYTDETSGFEEICARVKDYTNNFTIRAITIVTGYGARLSAPGYMDCTEWAVFGSVKDAEEYLEEAYGDEEEDEI